MNVENVLKQLNKEYPGKATFKNDENETTEILCEVEPASEHPEYSNAVAVIDKSVPHTHLKATETYKVLKGKLILHVEERSFSLNC